MAKDEDLKILGPIVVTRANQETRECSNDQAEEKQHRRILGCGRRESGFLTPTRSFSSDRRSPHLSSAGCWPATGTSNLDPAQFAAIVRASYRRFDDWLPAG